MSKHGTQINKAIRRDLEKIGAPLCKNKIYNRVAYPEAAMKGLSPVITEPDGAAARDISNIIEAIMEMESE